MQVGSYALAAELQSGEGETNSASVQAYLQQAVVGFSSGPWRVSRSMFVSSADGYGYSRKEAGCARVPGSLPWVISLLGGFLGCQKPLHSWDDLRHPLIL